MCQITGGSQISVQVGTNSKRNKRGGLNKNVLVGKIPKINKRGGAQLECLGRQYIFKLFKGTFIIQVDKFLGIFAHPPWTFIK